MIKAYHGSDRVFSKFDLKEMGSGDGRSTGGHGIYFNLIREVAQEYVTKSGALYECDIYEDGFWLDLDEIVPPDMLLIIYNRLVRMGHLLADITEFQNDFMNDEEPVVGQQVYYWLAATLGSLKNASAFLNKLGFDGNTFLDRGTVVAIAMKTNKPELLQDGKGRNYVVFDENNMAIKHMYLYDEMQQIED